MSVTATATGLRGISLVCVPTLDQDAAVEFYERLGFEKRTDQEASRSRRRRRPAAVTSSAPRPASRSRRPTSTRPTRR